MAREIPGVLLLTILWPVLLWALPAGARTLTVTPADDYRAIEAAQAGDIVEIAPGTYRFLVSLTQGGTADQPIIVRPQDPAHRPVWDLLGTPVSKAPGSYTAPDRGRGCWQVRAGHYHIQGIVFRNCVDHDSSGVRVVNVPDVTLSDCLFQNNTNGVIGDGEGLRIEFSEFAGNGDPLSGDAAAHSIYIYGGTLDVRYCYFHDSPKGEHFHLRSRDAVLAYNWFTRAGGYMGDLAPCEHFCGGAAGQGITQSLLLLGNVLYQGTQQNPTKLLAMYKDEAGSVDGTGDANRLEMTLVSNTIVGQKRPMGNAVVQLRNDQIDCAVNASDNLALDFTTFTAPQAPAAGNYSVDGAGNWLTTGTAVAGLLQSHFGDDPGLSPSYVPQAQSPVIGTAVAAMPVPQFEYYRDEKVGLMGRVRQSARDPGAFESTTSTPPFGPAGPGGAVDGGSMPDGLAGDGPAGAPAPPMGGGCGCTVSARRGAPAGPWVLLLCAALLLRFTPYRPRPRRPGPLAHPAAAPGAPAPTPRA